MKTRTVVQGTKPEPIDTSTPLGRAQKRLAEAICRVKKERSRESYAEYDKAKAALRKLEET